MGVRMTNRVQVGTIPAEAMSGATLNATPTAAERDPDGSVPRTDGPRRREGTGVYEPAEYAIAVAGPPGADGAPQMMTMIRRDR